MVFQILWALAYLKHEKRVHRDIKPSNLLINSKGEAKVSDFGISAELQNSVAMCGTFVGTFKYMSPERIRNQPYNYASVRKPPHCCSVRLARLHMLTSLFFFSPFLICVQDIWSLGLTLIECATGKYPYPDSRTCIDMIQSITESEAPTLREYISSSLFNKAQLFSHLNSSPPI